MARIATTRFHASHGDRHVPPSAASATPADAAHLCLGASEPFARQAWGEVVSKAIDMEDAHLVKYVHSCLRSASRKPAAEPIFLAAATRLLARWLVR